MNAYELGTQIKDLYYCPTFVPLVPAVYPCLPPHLATVLNFVSFVLLFPPAPFWKS